VIAIPALILAFQFNANRFSQAPILRGPPMLIRSLQILIIVAASVGYSQSWQQNDNVFNPSGIPSLPFSQPRFADMDNDGDQDLILGSISETPRYFINTGSVTIPHFEVGADIFAPVLELDCELGVCIDLDNDGDLDFISGGYSGLQFYENTGSPESATFLRIADFFSDLDLGSNPVPHMADMDGDDDQDLVIGYSEGGQVRYFQNLGTPEDAIFLQSESEDWFDVGLYAYPWFSDLDIDGDMDILIGRDGYGFYYYRNDGNETEWIWTDASSQFTGLGNDTYWNSPCLVDLTGDNLQDLVFGSASGPLNYYANTGNAENAEWTAVPTLFGGVLDVGGASNPVFIDFDDDGDFDLLSGSQLGDIKYYENTGTMVGPAWTANHGIFNSIDHSIYSAVAAGDISGDGLLDLVVGDLSGNLFYHRNTGSGFVYESAMFTGIGVSGWSSPRLFDLDSDQDLDLIIGDENGGISYFENTGNVIEAQWTEDPSLFGDLDVGSNAVITLGDVNLDGNLDMITGNLFHEIRLFSLERDVWVEHSEIVWEITAGQNASPALVDLNADGDLDLALGNYEGTFNYFENLTIVSVDKPKEYPQQVHLYAAYPNPFNPSTNIQFDLEKTEKISLQIYNINGKLVKTLLNQQLAQGTYHYSWDATNTQAEVVPSGVYLLVFQSKTTTLTRRLLFLK